MRTIALVIQSMRPKQWTKNLLVFAALIFAHEYTEPNALLNAVAAFVLFCILSGTVYLVNDVVDREEDAKHPRKRHRPIASGAVSPGTAIASAAVLAPLSLVGCFLVNPATAAVAAGYLGLTLCYHFVLKQKVIVDALTVAGGFVLRAVAGATAVQVEISPWLLLCTLLLALFLAFTKRRQEIIGLEDRAHTTRAILAEYTPHLLDQMIGIVTACTIMSYSLYTISQRTVHELGSRDLLLTIPFVMYGIFRYLYLVHRRGKGDAPERVLLTDRPLLATIAVYLAVVLLVFYLARGNLGGPLLPLNNAPY